MSSDTRRRNVESSQTGDGGTPIRLRFAKILSIANKLFGPTGVAVLEELAVHGRYNIQHTLLHFLFYAPSVIILTFYYVIIILSIYYCPPHH